MGPASDTFVREFLDGFLENRFINGSLTSDEYHAYRVALHAEEFRRAAKALFTASPSPVDIPGYGPLRIVQLREMDGTEFPFLQGLLPTLTSKSLVTCFIGHRFLKEIEGPLRFNLAHLLNPHGAKLKWSAQDLTATDLFRDIVVGIRGADMCFFDNFGTANRPNVYIEVGIAYALGVPMIVAEYTGGGLESVAESVPSDLQGLFRIHYATYEELCRKLYFGLPAFFSRNKMRPRKRQR